VGGGDGEWGAGAKYLRFSIHSGFEGGREGDTN